MNGLSTRVYEIATANLSNLDDKEFGFETVVDTDLGWRMVGGRNNYGEITRFLGKDKAARVTTLGITTSLTLTNTVTGISTDGTLDSDTDNDLVTEKAIKTYVDNNSGGVSDHGDLTGLDDDDHSAVYYNETRINTWFGNKSVNDLGELTANWDAGSYKITAETFTSDIATGTAPFTVISTTKVTNLNADAVDGYSFNQALQTTSSPSFVAVTASTGNITANAGYIDSKAYYYIDGSKFISIDGTGNMMIGEGAGNGGVSTGGIHFGFHAGFSTTAPGIDCVNIGNEAGQAQENAIGCINIGGGAGYSNISGGYCNFIGYKAGYNNKSQYNTYIGYKSGFTASAAGAYGNLGIGYRTLHDNIGGKENTAIGDSAGARQIGSSAVLIGYAAATQAQFCTSAVVIGNRTCYLATANLSRVTAIGALSNYSAPTKFGGVSIGYCAGAYDTASNNLFINDRDRGSQANDRVQSLIYGLFNASTANQLVRLNGITELTVINSGATQVAAGAGANEVWKTSGHATLPDNVLMIGV